MIAWQNKLTQAEGFNASAMLQNRGEFALILATLATAAGLDPRLTPFAGLYVLSMSIVGPVLAVNSERMGRILFRSKLTKAAQPVRDRMRAEDIALVEAAMSGKDIPEPRVVDDSVEVYPHRDGATSGTTDGVEADPYVERARQQPDELFERKRDPEY